MALASAAALLAAAIAAAFPARAADLPEPAIRDTPLVLKDGRMAYVTVQPVPFEPGGDAMTPATGEALARFASGIATDCFLTAQAIGHVEGDAVAADGVATHRLGRARADRVATVLAQSGLPRSALAVVWDWQALVREPRVTLWVFRMHEGEDCRGTPLPRPDAAPALTRAEPAPASPPPAPDAPRQLAAAPAAEPTPPPVAEMAPPAQQTAPPVPPVQAAAAADAQPFPADPTLADPPPASLSSPTRLAAAEPASPPAAAVPPSSEPPKKRAGGKTPPPTAHRQAPASSASATAPAGGLAEPPAPAAGPDVQAPAPIEMASIESGGTTAAAAAHPKAGRLELEFGSNSSYLPDGAGDELRRWLAAQPAGRPLSVRIAATVGAGENGAGAAQAARYDRWLAERRAGRVVAWLEKNAASREIKVSRAYLDNDASRRVVVEARPQP